MTATQKIFFRAVLNVIVLALKYREMISIKLIIFVLNMRKKVICLFAFVANHISVGVGMRWLIKGLGGGE